MENEHAVNILLIEDSPVHAELITVALQTWDRQTFLTVARTLAEGRRLLAESIPNLAIVDYMLPDGLGTELLPAEGEEATVPLLIMTSYGNEQEAVKAMRAGALDYLVKSPAMLTDMPRVVERALRSWEQIRQRKEAEESLRRSEERWHSAFDNAAAGMLIISPDGKLLQVNSWICHLLGYREEELVGRTIEAFIHPEDLERTAFIFDSASFGNKNIHFEKRYRCKDGRVIWGHTSVACVYNDNHLPVYCIGLVQDITDRVSMEEELRRANLELDAFVRTVSHDLRSPLTPIIGYTELLMDMDQEQLAEQSRPYLDEINRQGHRMMALLEDLLALAQVGQLDLPTEPVQIKEVVKDIILGQGCQLVKANMRVETGEMPITRLPKTLLAQILDNLIANAIRYAGPGGVIKVTGERRENLFRLSVQDQGPGIPEKERLRIFDLFYRSAPTSGKDGTGVGLATVAKIAKLYNGHAWVDETPGGGSTFHVEMVDDLSE